MRPLYKELASLIGAYKQCIKTNNDEWERKHKEAINNLVMNYLPSGSGIDHGCVLDLDKSFSEKLVISSSFHRMDDNGMYCGWVDFFVVVTPSLIHDFHLRITGKASHQRYHLKDYLYDTFDSDLRRLVYIVNV